MNEFPMPVHWRRNFEIPAGYATTTGKTPVAWVRVGDRLAPKHIEAHFRGETSTVDLELRLEVRGGVPRCTDVRLHTVDGGREVQPGDLTRLSGRLSGLVADIYAAMSMPITNESAGTMSFGWENDRQFADASAHATRLRTARRKIDRPLLERVAETYRANMDHNPTESVALSFGVAHRTAARWVEMARSSEFGLLPPTSPGRKQA